MGSDRIVGSPCIEAWEFHQFKGGALWCHASYNQEKSTEQLVNFDLEIFDEEAGLVASCIGFKLMLVSKEKLFLNFDFSKSVILEKELYELAWERSEALSEVELKSTRAETWIVFADNSEFCKELIDEVQKLGVHCICVSAKGYSNSYANCEIDFEDQNAFETHWAGIARNIDPTRPLRKILHFWSLLDLLKNENELAAERLQRAQCFGVESVLGILRTVQANRINLNGLYVFTRGGLSHDDRVGPQSLSQSMVWGLARPLAVEHPELGAKFIDLGEGQEGAKLAEILREISIENVDEQILLRSGMRWVRRLALANLGTAKLRNANQGWIVPKASYLITGGAGGLGLALAIYLVDHGAENLILLGRSELKAEIKSWMREQQEMNVRICYQQVDVANYQELKKCLEEVKKEYPELRGVFHVAGVGQPRPLKEENRASSELVISGKAYGALNLHLLTQGMPLDHFVTFSSVATYMPAVGQGAYAVANTFLQSLINYRSSRGEVGHNIIWGIWTEVGMSVGLNQSVLKGGMTGIGLEEGFGFLEKALSQPHRNLSPAHVNWEQFEKLLDDSSREGFFSKVLKTKVRNHNKKAGPSPFVRQLKSVFGVERRELLIQFLKEQVLELSKRQSQDIDLGAGFMSMGLDSLGTIEYKNRLKAALNYKFPATLIFKYPDIDQLADYILKEVIVGEVNQEAEVKDRPQLQAKIKSLKRDEAIAIVGMSCPVSSLQASESQAEQGTLRRSPRNPLETRIETRTTRD